MLISPFDTEDIEYHIDAFEEKHSFRFPESYRNFLLKYNGGWTPNTTFTMGKKKGKHDLIGFYGLGSAEYSFSKIESWISAFTEYFSDSVVPISEEPLSGDVFIGIDGEKRGVIFYRYHHTPKRYHKVNDSFEEFVAQCESKPFRVKTIEERKERMIEVGREDEIPNFIESWKKMVEEDSKIVQEELIL